MACLEPSVQAQQLAEQAGQAEQARQADQLRQSQQGQQAQQALQAQQAQQVAPELAPQKESSSGFFSALVSWGSPRILLICCCLAPY